MSGSGISGMVVSMGIWSVVAGGASAQSPSRPPEDLSDYLPPGGGKTVVSAQCAACHSLQGTIQLRKPKDDWQAVVYDMVARGAPLSVEEADQAVEYLSSVFGPKAPPLVDVNTAAKDDLLKLPGMTGPLADRLIAHRTDSGALSSRDQVREVLGLNEQTFEKMKWYLKVVKQP